GGLAMRFLPVLVLLAHVALVTSSSAQSTKTPRFDVNGDPLPDGAVARLGTVRFQPPGGDAGKDRFKSFRFMHVVANTLSPDGKVVATAFNHQDSTRLEFMDTATGRSVRKLDVPNVSPSRLVFSPNGKSLVFPGSAINLADAQSGKVTKSIAAELASFFDS